MGLRRSDANDVSSSEEQDPVVRRARRSTAQRHRRRDENDEPAEETRKIPRLAEPDSTSTLVCLVQNCNTLGHLNGTSHTHNLRSSCPTYHRMTADTCHENNARWKKERALDGERLKELAIHFFADRQNLPSPPCDNVGSLAAPPKMGADLTNLTSMRDLDLFRQAQNMAIKKKDYELRQHHLLSGTEEYFIKRCVLGKYSISAPYTSPYSKEIASCPVINICEFCLKPMSSSLVASRHTEKCIWRHPPGDEIYRKGILSVFEVDGDVEKTYCQHLCLLSKLFLSSKTLYREVEGFFFYVLCQVDEYGCHILGYFSKEKSPLMSYNLSCLLVLPPHMRHGYGRFLIDFSYLLSRLEMRIGSPERPLSDLGLMSYRNYWKSVLIPYLSNSALKDLSIKDISQESGVHQNDLMSTLQWMGLVKYWKGQHIILRKPALLAQFIRVGRRKTRLLDPDALKWKPPKAYNTRSNS